MIFAEETQTNSNSMAGMPFVVTMIVARHTHKRSSSQWIPPSAPLHNPVSVFRGRSSRAKG
ncbi:hypothetical protein NECAME_11682 [Necator americanus]|uniref:Uncharacterized protein n=1 Tax=Necator americanus TaxID=51031 RepID=W2T624_NECAM|nr:hypothetical protein NECAME_11682 [Necator americanus]ETN76422.1 hypothetical protein NECAME_11682 [Necator americanus]